MAIDDGALELPVVVTGAGQAVADLRTVDQAATRTAQAQTQGAQATTRAAQQATTAQTALGQATQRSGVQVQQFGSTLGLAAQGIGRFSQSGGQMVGILGQAVGSIGSMSAAMGPWGIAIGIATTAFGLLSSALSDTSTETSDMAETIRREAIPALDDIISRANELQQALTVRSRVRAGRGSSLEQAAYSEELQHYISRQGEYAASAREQGEFAQADRYEREQRRARADLEVRRRMEQAAIEREVDEASQREAAERNRRERAAYEMDLEAAGGAPGRGRGGAAAARRRAAAELRELLAFQQGIAADQRARRGTQLGTVDMNAQNRAEFEHDQARIQGIDAANRARGSSRNRVGGNATTDAQGMTSGFAAAAEQAERLRDATLQVGDAIAEVAKRVVDGEQNIGAALLEVAGERIKAVGYEMIAKGAAHFLEGLAMTFSLATAGPGLALMGVGGKEVALGTAFVAGGYLAASAGAAIGGGSGGGGGGSRRGSEPARVPQAESNGPRMLVVNINDARVLMGDKAQLGRAVTGYIEAGAQRWG